MKKVLAMILSCVMVLGLTACGETKHKWTEEDLNFTNGSDTVTVEEGSIWYGYDDIGYLVYYIEEYEDEFEGSYATNRGLQVGMTLDDYKELYRVSPGYAVWEIVSGEQGEYTEFAAYNDDDPADMYTSSDRNCWLNIGYYKVGDTWKALKDYEVQDVWLCDADQAEFQEVAILSVNIDYDGTVIGISLSNIKYDDVWVEWQAWE